MRLIQRNVWISALTLIWRKSWRLIQLWIICIMVTLIIIKETFIVSRGASLIIFLLIVSCHTAASWTSANARISLFIIISIDLRVVVLHYFLKGLWELLLQGEEHLLSDETVRASLMSNSDSFNVQEICNSIQAAAFKVFIELMLETFNVKDVREETLHILMENFSRVRQRLIHQQPE